jgi:dimethylaniline monooxygenase (N-oxide forming)
MFCTHTTVIYPFQCKVPKQLYEVQDFPMTEVEEGEYPSAVHVQRYLERMVKAFRLQDLIRLNTFVESVDQNEDGTWEVSIKHLKGDRSTSTQERHSFDYLISATGLYSNRDAFLPSDIEGMDKYQGQILHSSQFTDASIAKGQRVIVVGGGKSAIDCAVEAHKAGADRVTLLSRKAHWPTPRQIAGVIPFQYVFLSRFGTALVSAHRGVYPDEGTGTAVSLFRKFGWPIVGGAFYAVEALFRLQLGLFGDRSPKADVVDDFYGEIQIESNCV